MYVCKNVDVVKVDIGLIKPILLKIWDEELVNIIVARLKDVWKDKHLTTVLPNLPYNCFWVFEGQDSSCPTGVIIDEHVDNIRVELTAVVSDVEDLKFDINLRYNPIKVETVEGLLNFDNIVNSIGEIVTNSKVTGQST